MRQESDAPVFVGSADDGDQIACACGSLLAARLHRNAIFNISFRCFRCREVTDGPVRPAGFPVDPSIWTFDVGEFHAGHQIIPRGVSITGTLAVQDRTAEVEAGLRRVAELDPQALPDFLRGLLGSRFDVAVERYRRGAASRTPPRRVHRLAELVVRTPELLRAGSPTPVELVVACTVFSFWSNDPAWEEMREAISDSTNYVHNLLTLTLAWHLLHQGQGIGLFHPPVRDHRIADLRWMVGAREVHVEVKTPACLQRSLADNSSPRTIDHVKTLSDALSGTSGQLNTADAGMVAIGSLGLGDLELDRLETAAGEVLARTARQRLMAIVLVNLHMVGSQAGVTIRVARNGAYDDNGDLRLAT